MELLYLASSTLHPHSDEGEISRHLNEFTHLFLPNGVEITNLRDVPDDTTMLICAKSKIFKGIIDTNKVVSYNGSIKLKKKNI